MAAAAFAVTRVARVAERLRAARASKLPALGQWTPIAFPGLSLLLRSFLLAAACGHRDLLINPIAQAIFLGLRIERPATSARWLDQATTLKISVKAQQIRTSALQES